jgi:hypothetical protein
MKRFAIVSMLSLCASGAFAQGTLQFYNTFGSTPGSEMLFQVYAPTASATSVQIQGPTAAQVTADGSANLANDVEDNTPTTYTGVAIGGSLDASPSTVLPGTPFSAARSSFDAGLTYGDGNDFTAEIYALSAGSQSVAFATATPAFSSLLPVSQYTENFATTGGTGNANLNYVSPPGDPGIPGTGLSGAGTRGSPYVQLNNAFVAVAAWYNAGGSITSLSQAIAQNVPNGVSAVQLILGLGEPSSITSALAGSTQPASFPAIPYYLESFNLTYISTPEPSTIALGFMGVCGFLARRRKK